MTTIYNTIKQQFDVMLQRGIMPLFEFERDINGSVEWFTVDIELTEKGIEFSFDQDNYPTFFDGEIVKQSDNFYLLPFDGIEYRITDNECLDQYFELIHANIIDGYLAANNIQTDE